MFKRYKLQKKRIQILAVGFTIIFGILSYKLKVIMLDKRQELSVMTDMQYSNIVNTSDLNYLVYDRNGKPLLQYKKRYYVEIDIASFKKNDLNSKSDDLFALIFILRNYNSSYDLSNIGFANESNKISYEIDENTYNKLKGISGVKGFYTYYVSEVNRSEAWRIENLITNIRNPKDNSVKDEESLELKLYNKTKNNEKPRIKFEKDLEGNISSGQYIYPKNNTNIRLTIDKVIQDNIKTFLNVEKYKKNSQIGVVLMESSTGKILAMTQKDDGLPNVNLGSATENGFVPGSIFKVIVEESGFENKKLSLLDKFNCEQDIYKLEKEGKNHGVINSETALIKSCNNVFAQIGDNVGLNNFIETAKSQGLFNSVLGMDKSIEVSGDYVLPKNPGEGSGQLAIGQSMRITPIQAVSIANTVVNNGIYVKPYIVDAFVDDNNIEKDVIKTESHNAISKVSANLLKNQMIKVVNQGTGVSARIENIEIGGKTGTSTRLDGSKRSSDGWFVGFFKLGDKYYSMVVFVKDIDVDNDQAATTAAPIFKDIVKLIGNYLQR